MTQENPGWVVFPSLVGPMTTTPSILSVSALVRRWEGGDVISFYQVQYMSPGTERFYQEFFPV